MQGFRANSKVQTDVDIIFTANINTYNLDGVIVLEYKN